FKHGDQFLGVGYDEDLGCLGGANYEGRGRGPLTPGQGLFAPPRHIGLDWPSCSALVSDVALVWLWFVARLRFGLMRYTIYSRRKPEYKREYRYHRHTPDETWMNPTVAESRKKALEKENPHLEFKVDYVCEEAGSTFKDPHPGSTSSKTFKK